MSSLFPSLVPWLLSDYLMGALALLYLPLLFLVIFLASYPTTPCSI